MDTPVEKVMGPKLPTIGVGQTVELAVQMLDDGAGPAGAVRRPPAERAHPHRRPVVLRGAVAAMSDRPVSEQRWVSSTEQSGVGVRDPGDPRRPARPTRRPARSCTPISLATTFAQDGVGGHKGFEYSRSGNPTRTALETCVASLEGARHGLAFASGLAAEDNVLRLLAPGQRVLLGNDAYGGTFRLISKVWAPLGLPWTAVDLTDVDALAADWPDDTGMVWLETPTNPLLTCFDIEAVADDRPRPRGAGGASTTRSPRRTCSSR